MRGGVRITRRQFLKSTGATAGALTLGVPARVPYAAAPGAAAVATDRPLRWRVDGLPKVTGQKVYARDFRARDMPGWPARTWHALLLRARRSDRRFLGVDLGALSAELHPTRVVLAEDLERDAVSGFDVFVRPLLVPRDRAATHAGQPVAILIFESFRTYWQASRRLRAGDVVRFGPADPTLAREPVFGAVHYVRWAGMREDRFSRVRDGSHDPDAVGVDVEPSQRALNVRARRIRDDVGRTIATRGWRVVEGTFSTQVVDPMFMEPEAGLAWWDPATRRLHVVLGSQSPEGDRRLIAGMFGDPHCAFRLAAIDYTSCYPGGGFGGREFSPTCLYLALAAAYAGGPVRLAFDRFEQFQSGIKRHASTIRGRLAVDGRGTLQAFETSIVLAGGGEPNLTVPVVQVCALSAAGPYRIPRTVIGAVGRYSDGAAAGGMRGFGIPQAAFAIESLVDEAAAVVGEDPIRFRLHHVLRRGERDVSGMPLEHHLANVEVCRLALAQPLWAGREADKRRRDGAETAYGVGFACCMQAYGTEADGSVADVAIDARGAVTVRTHIVDMGQGSATALAVAPLTGLGQSATRVEMGQTAPFDVLGLTTGPARPEHPRWTPFAMGSTGASMSAFFHVHSVEEACRVIFDHGVLPAAMALWRRPTAPDGVRWSDGRLIAPGLRPLAAAEIAARMHRDGRVVAAMVHTYYRARFAEAAFTLDGRTARRAIDALAVRRAGRSSYDLLDRRAVVYPPARTARYDRSLYASGGHIVAVEVTRASGAVRVVDAVSILDAGEVIHRELLHGQIEGGFVQGLGYALFEELPRGAENASGEWNLHRYRVPRLADLPPGRLSVVLVPPPPDGILASGPRLRKKGIAEATLTTVAPAVANAVAHATGRRITSLPLTPARVLEALGRA